MSLSKDIDQETEGCQRICDLPDDMLLEILRLVPIKDAVATEILSKRWRHVWKMMRKLDFTGNQDSESFGRFIDKSLQLHKAPKLVNLIVELGPRCLVDVDVRKWVKKAVNQGVIKLDFNLLWRGVPTSFPKSLYTCDTLVNLCLSNQILVDVSFPVSLPSLLYLYLLKVVYKDEDSLARLLSSSPALYLLEVERHKIRGQDKEDNLKNFTVKVPSLKILGYWTNWRKEEEEEEEEEEQEQEQEQEQEEEEDHIGSLVIDSPALTDLCIVDEWRDYYIVIGNMLSLDEVYIGFANPDEKFLRCLSSATRLCLHLSELMVACCNAIELSRLIDLFFFAEHPVDWLEPLIILLQNSPKLKTLTITTPECPPSSWNQPSTIPGCLSSHLEIVRWREYEGKEYEKQLMTYILANSNCLKTVEILFAETCNLEECQKELESMPRISPSSRLIYSNPQADWTF